MTGADFSDKGTLEKKFLERTEYSRRTGTPIWVGEFGPILQDQPGRRVAVVALCTAGSRRV